MYINTQTQEYPITERQIHEAFPNVSFSRPFKPPADYSWVFPKPKPSFDSVIQRAQEIIPVLTELGHYEQAWEVVSKFVEYEDDEGVVHTIAEQEAAAIAADLLQKQEALAKQIDVIRYSKIYMESIPYTFPGDTEPDGVQMRDETDRQNIQDVIIDATVKDPNTIMYMMPTSNNIKPMTAAQVIEMGQYLKSRGDQIMQYSWQLKAQISAVETTEELNTIGIETGWPV